MSMSTKRMIRRIEPPWWLIQGRLLHARQLESQYRLKGLLVDDDLSWRNYEQIKINGYFAEAIVQLRDHGSPINVRESSPDRSAVLNGIYASNPMKCSTWSDIRSPDMRSVGQWTFLFIAVGRTARRKV